MNTSTLMLSDIVYLAQLYISAVLSSQETDLRFACKPGKAVLVSIGRHFTNMFVQVSLIVPGDAVCKNVFCTT